MAKDDEKVVQLKPLTEEALGKALDDLSRLKTASASEAGKIGPMVEKFEKTYGVPKSVLALLSKMDRMSEGKKSDYVRGLEMALPLARERLGMSDMFAAKVPAEKKSSGKKADIAAKPKAGTVSSAIAGIDKAEKAGAAAS